MSINNCSVGPKIRTNKIYEQTYKYAVNKDHIKSSLPCYFLLNGFYLKSLLFIFIHADLF